MVAGVRRRVDGGSDVFDVMEIHAIQIRGSESLQTAFNALPNGARGVIEVFFRGPVPATLGNLKRKAQGMLTFRHDARIEEPCTLAYNAIRRSGVIVAQRLQDLS